MRQSKIKRVVVHTERVDRAALAERVSAYHADIIERRLKDTALTTARKMAVIDGIVELLQVSEGNNGASSQRDTRC